MNIIAQPIPLYILAPCVAIGMLFGICLCWAFDHHCCDPEVARESDCPWYRRLPRDASHHSVRESIMTV